MLNFKKNLIIGPEYGKKTINWIKRKIRVLKRVFVALNIFILFAALVTSLFAIFITAYLGSSLPFWYPYVTAGIGAFTTFTTSMINFFVVRDKIKNYQVAFNKIWIEINKFNSKLVNKYKNKERNWHLFVAIEAILGNEAAKLEVINE